MIAPAVTPGFAERHRAEVARLFWQAFEGKLGFAMAPEDKALAFIEANLQPSFAFTCVDAQGTLLGAAGIKTEKGGLLTGDYRDIARVYGYFGGLWRGAVLEIFERKLEPGTLSMDGIFVAEEARGQGVGTALLDAIVWTARMNRYRRVRLDVIDSNPRARALYERYGFKAQETTQMGALSLITGFREATAMVLTLPDAQVVSGAGGQ